MFGGVGITGGGSAPASSNGAGVDAGRVALPALGAVAIIRGDPLIGGRVALAADRVGGGPAFGQRCADQRQDGPHGADPVGSQVLVVDPQRLELVDGEEVV